MSILSWLRCAKTLARRPQTRLRLEALEDRSLPSATLVADLVPGAASAYPRGLTDVNGTLYFSTEQGLHTSDGTAVGTALVKSNVRAEGFTPAGGSVFFTTGFGGLVYKTDGTAAGTVLLAGMQAGYEIRLVPFNGKVYWAANDGYQNEIWVSDGTPAGTHLALDIYPGTTTERYCYRDPFDPRGKPGECYTYTYLNSSDPRGLAVVNGSLMFTAIDGNKYGIYRSDGTPAGTTRLASLSGQPTPYSHTVSGGAYYFAVGGGLWRSDGTAAGTARIKNLQGVSNLTDVGGTLYFAGTDGDAGTELWKSDGTAAGTVLVKDIYPGLAGRRDPNDSMPAPLTAAGGTLYFTADDGVHGRELWKSDGTAAGTVLVADISAGAASTTIWEAETLNGLLYFPADDGIHGRELWVSDGTATGTALAADINPGAAGSGLAGLTTMNGKLYFAAFEPVHGAELWEFAPADVLSAELSLFLAAEASRRAAG